MTRKKIGLLFPANNSAVEADFWRTVPDGVTVHSERLWNEVRAGSTDGPASTNELNADVERAASYVARVRPDIIVYACTSGGFVGGLEHDRDLQRRITAVTGGIPSVSTTQSVVDTLRELPAKRLSVATPYGRWVNEALQSFLIGIGFDVLRIEGEPRLTHSSVEVISDQPPEEIHDFVCSNVAAGSDAVFLSCTGWRAMEAIDTIEKTLAIPVVTSNQATIHQTLRRLFEA